MADAALQFQPVVPVPKPPFGDRLALTTYVAAAPTVPLWAWPERSSQTARGAHALASWLPSSRSRRTSELARSLPYPSEEGVWHCAIGRLDRDLWPLGDRLGAKLLARGGRRVVEGLYLAGLRFFASVYSGTKTATRLCQSATRNHHDRRLTACALPITPWRSVVNDDPSRNVRSRAEAELPPLPPLHVA